MSFTRVKKPVFVFGASSDDSSDDEPAFVIEKIEQVYQNGETFVETEKNYEIQNKTCSHQLNEIDQSIHSLCRVCSSQGFISINSELTSKLMVVTPSASDKAAWQKPISRLITEVSGEEISESDGLPQFICQHCLGYLQHAYLMRLKIRSNTANLRLAKSLACERSLLLEQSICKPCTDNKREIDLDQEELFEDAKFLATFKNANISIANGPTATKRSEKLTEHKCETCKKRMMTQESLAEHQKVCEMRIISSFDAQFRYLIGMIHVQRITTNEFVLRTIKLIFDTQKDLAKIVSKTDINVNSIAKASMEQLKARPYQSPDIGYFSDAPAASKNTGWSPVLGNSYDAGPSTSSRNAGW